VDEAKNRLIAPNCIRLLGLLNASQALGQKRLVENSAKKERRTGMLGTMKLYEPCEIRSTSQIRDIPEAQRPNILSRESQQIFNGKKMVCFRRRFCRILTPSVKSKTRKWFSNISGCHDCSRLQLMFGF
jgi:hypothetical protein